MEATLNHRANRLSSMDATPHDPISTRQEARIVRLYRVLGILGATAAYPFIAISIALSPWFNFYNHALSDLGNLALNGPTGWIYNIGLMVSGFLVASFSSLVSLRNPFWKYLIWTVPLAAAGVDLAMIGFFPEDAGRIHLIVSVAFFALIDVTMFLYSYASWPLGSPAIGAVALVFGMVSAAIWFVGWPWRGVAIQEAVTSAMMAIWLIMVCLRKV